MRLVQSGFSLIQLSVALAVMGVLVLVGYPAYQNHIRNAGLNAAYAALMEDARFMERFFQQKGTFKKSSTEWPPLPVVAAGGFCIRPNNNARGIPGDRFTLKAVAFDRGREPRVLKLDDSLNAVVCASSASSCEAGEGFFKGGDQDCRVFKP